MFYRNWVVMMLVFSSVLAFFAGAMLLLAEPKTHLFVAIQEQSPELLKLQGEAVHLEFQNEGPLNSKMTEAQNQMRQMFKETKNPKWVLQVELINLGDEATVFSSDPKSISGPQPGPLLLQISLISTKTKNKKAEYGIKLETQEGMKPLKE
ncbi:MAG: hypothetical protein WCH11_00480 [Bdellovibrio sp.]